MSHVQISPSSWPPQDLPAVSIWTDKDCAERLRDRVARQIAGMVDGGCDADDMAHLRPVFRWLNDIAETVEE